MLIESLVYGASLLGAPASSRKFIFEAIGLWGRGRRQKQAWASHTKHTRDTITKAMETIRLRRTVVVLGSGPLFDVPLHTLSRAFGKVVLVDRVHLLPARFKARAFSNVELSWRDLSTATHPDPLGFLTAVPELDWVISVNLVSQLAQGAPDGSERRVVDAHLDALGALPCPVTLITDLDYQVFDSTGRVLEKYDLLYGRAMPESAHRWEWDLAPFGEESPATRRAHSVAAYPDWKGVMAQA